MNRHQWTLLGGAGLGAGLMWLLDPEQGGRRRGQARNKAVHLLHQGGDALGKTSRDLANRTKGAALRTGKRLRQDNPSDEVLHERVRARLGHLVSHPSALQVEARDGHITLTGDTLADEAGRLLAGVRKVRGVREVENRLEIHQEAGDNPALQGGGRPGWAQRNLEPTTRLALSAAGGALTLAGFRRRGALGTAAGALGLGLLARGLTNLETKRLLGIASGRRAVTFHKTINVQEPARVPFEFWSNFENFPRFMENVLEVKNLGDNRSRWVVRGPAGTTLEWNAELTAYEPERLIAWKTEPGAAVQSAGQVHFSPNSEGGTQIDIQMSYNPPGGALGHTVASLLGRDPRREMDEDLLRFKSIIEEGKATAGGETVTRSEVEAGFETART